MEQPIIYVKASPDFKTPDEVRLWIGGEKLLGNPGKFHVLSIKNDGDGWTHVAVRLLNLFDDSDRRLLSNADPADELFISYKKLEKKCYSLSKAGD